jgi:hypothetical protein
LAITYYSLPDIKKLGLKSARKIHADYEVSDVEHAYTYAAARCGFENPMSTDADYGIKQMWLLRMMSLYFYYDMLKPYSAKFDVEGLKLNQLVRNMRRDIIDPEEKAFTAAMADSRMAHIFESAADHFGVMVDSTGINDDAVGVFYDAEEEG